MTKEEQKLLDELKKFFTEKYDDEWEEKFKKYTKKLVNDGHLEQEVIDDYLEFAQPDEIVKRFNTFIKTPIETKPKVKVVKKTPTIRTSRTLPTYDGCGMGGSSSRSDGCGYTPRTITPSRQTDGCGSSGGSGRSRC